MKGIVMSDIKHVKGRWFRAIAATALIATATCSIGCGYFLYPERRGSPGGRIDGGTMVMDLLWLIPGVVPGVVALIVDFSSGAMYVGRDGRMAIRTSSDGHVAVRLPYSAKPMMVDVRLVTSSHHVVAHKIVRIGPASPAGESVELVVGDAPAHDEIYLELASV